MSNSIGDFICAMFPSSVNKEGEVFKALLASPDGGGTIESILNEVELERKRWYAKDIYSLKGEQLVKAFSAISHIVKSLDEGERIFLAFNELLFYRAGDSIWGNYYNVLRTFRDFFDSERVYIVNNTGEYKDSLIQDGDFNLRDEHWQVVGNKAYDEGDTRFEGERSFILSQGTILRQTVSLTQGSYFLHAFIRGAVKVTVTNGEGLYWCPTHYTPQAQDGECKKQGVTLYRNDALGQWQQEPYSFYYESAVWDDKSLFFIGGGDMTVSFESAGEESEIDYIRLWPKGRESSFSLITVFGEVYNKETVNLAPMSKDGRDFSTDYDSWGYELVDKDTGEVIGREWMKEHSGYKELPVKDHYILRSKDGAIVIDYEYMTYYTQAYFSGLTSPSALAMYLRLLELLAPAGVLYYAELLSCNIASRKN